MLADFKSKCKIPSLFIGTIASVSNPIIPLFIFSSSGIVLLSLMACERSEPPLTISIILIESNVVFNVFEVIPIFVKFLHLFSKFIKSSLVNESGSHIFSGNIK